MTSYDRLKSKRNVMHIGKKFVRLMQLNSRFSIIFLFILIFLCLILFNQISAIAKTHKFILNIFGKSCRDGLNDRILGKSHLMYYKSDKNFEDEYKIVWGNETIELFKDQLGLTFNDDDGDDKRNMKCRYGEFLISALPGPDEENFPEVLWQFFSLDALEQTTIQCDEEKRLTLKAVYTERMLTHLNQIFDGLPLETITNFPSSCSNLKYAKIIGNISPIELRKIVTNTPFLLDPKAKRWKEISMRFYSKRPLWRMKPDVMRKVQREFQIAKTITRSHKSHDEDGLNFVGIYISSDDKLPPEFYQQAMNFHQQNSTKRSIFMVICDPQNLIFCREVFEKDKDAGVNGVHLMRKSTDVFDFVLMSSCNSNIISNDMGVLHALINGGTTVVYKPELKDDPQFYVPWLISERMDNWHSIGSNA